MLSAGLPRGMLFGMGGASCKVLRCHRSIQGGLLADKRLPPWRKMTTKGTNPPRQRTNPP
eukprot:352209-Chlamydomonas_euryale.AAC.2